MPTLLIAGPTVVWGLEQQGVPLEGLYPLPPHGVATGGVHGARCPGEEWCAQSHSLRGLECRAKTDPHRAGPRRLWPMFAMLGEWSVSLGTVLPGAGGVAGGMGQQQGTVCVNDGLRRQAVARWLNGELQLLEGDRLDL